MDNVNSIIADYLKITGGYGPEVYLGPEEQAKHIVRCSILKDINLEYDSFTHGKLVSSDNN